MTAETDVHDATTTIVDAIYGQQMSETPPPFDPRAPLAPKSGFRRRGRVTKWLAIGWLALLTFTAIGASRLPYVNHSCSQFDNATMCSTP